MSHQVDWDLYAQRYRRFLSILGWLSYAPGRYRYHLAGYTARYFSPQRYELAYKFPRVIKSCYPNGELDPNAVWLRFLHHTGAASLNTFRFAKMNPDWLKNHVKIVDHANLAATYKQGKGVLVMTYHNHHTMLFLSCIGMLGFPLYTIANDPKNTPLYPMLKKWATLFYENTEAHFSGGQYCYVQDEASMSTLRIIAKVLRQGNILCSLNDFPTSNAVDHYDLQLFGQNITCPVGSIKMALRQQSPIVVGWIRWLAKEEFVLELHPITANDIAGVMSQYQQYLYQLIQTDPGNWEGWGWLNFDENIN